MAFNTIPFFIFLLFFTIFFYLVRDKRKRIILIVVGSWSLFAYANLISLLFLVLASLTTWFFAKRLVEQRKSSFNFYTAIFILLLLLAVAKYSGKLGYNSHINDDSYFALVILPVGISFYILQAIGLLYDTYKKKYQSKLNFITVSAFLGFFPQSLSGPIHRANELIPQLEMPAKFLSANIIYGFKIILLGLFCKLMVADKISLITAPLFGMIHKHDGLSLLIGSYLYSFQIYFDFWGYSFLAIGIGRLLGFRININFNHPYLASSFRDFWHRWHITLSKWLKDYVYIPLGGRTNGKVFHYAIVITFLVSGFWHGITLNFICWGLMHALLYLTEDFIRQHNSKYNSYFATSAIKYIRIFLIFTTITFTWLIFRTENLTELSEIFRKILIVSEWSTQQFSNYFFTWPIIVYLIFIICTITAVNIPALISISEKPFTSKRFLIVESLIISLCLIIIVLFGDIGNQEFLYFNF